MKTQLDDLQTIITNQESLITSQSNSATELEKYKQQNSTLITGVLEDFKVFKQQTTATFLNYQKELEKLDARINSISTLVIPTTTPAPVVVTTPAPIVITTPAPTQTVTPITTPAPVINTPTPTQSITPAPTVPTTAVPVSESISVKGQAQSTHFSSYIKWDEVPGAEYYIVNKNGIELTVVNGNDTWDVEYTQNSEVTYTVQPMSTTADKFDPIKIVAKTATAPVIDSKSVGDYKDLTNVSLKGSVVSGYKFAASDVGKVISLSATRKASWYREAPMWSHTFIKEVTASGDAIIETKVYKNIPLGTPAAELVDSPSTFGYFATNNFDTLKIELSSSTPSTVKLTGDVYADPSRTEWYVDNIVEKQGNSVGMIKVNNPALLVTGNIIFGGEDLLGHRENNVIIPYTEWYPYNIFHHKGGLFAWRGNVRGCQTVCIMNRTGQSRFKFYQKDIETVPNCQFIYSGTFGDRLNYQTGFTNIADSQRGKATAGKDLVACINANLYVSEPFVVRPYTPQAPPTDKVSLTFGKRFLMRNTTVNGSAFSKPSIPVDAVIEDLKDGTAKITVDKTKYPTFSFYSNVGIWSRLPLIFKSPDTAAGSINAFQNSVGKYVSKINNAYEVLVKVEGDPIPGIVNKPMIFGNVRLITCQDMQPTIPWEGHVLYTSSLVEIEIYNVHLMGLLSFLLRANNSDNYSGYFNQFSMSKITYTSPSKTNPRFDDIKEFGGYVQFAEWPGPPYIQATVQGFNPNKKALMYKCQEPNAVNQNGGMPFLVVK